MARYIDADKLLEDLQEEIDFETTMYTEEQNKWFNIGLRCAVRNVRQQPAADVAEVKHGRWIKNQYISQVLKIPVKKEYVFTCSLCGHDTLGKSKYCRECGAKMDGGKIDDL